MPREWSQMQWEIPGTPSEYPLSQLLRPWLILLGCFLPALGMFLYNRSSILDKYVARTWFTAFIMCTAILTLIYIIGDFADNVGDLMNLDAPLTLSLIHILLTRNAFNAEMGKILSQSRLHEHSLFFP